MKKIFFWFFFWANVCQVWALPKQMVILNNKNDYLHIGKQTYYYEDREGTLTIQDIIKANHQEKFILHDKDVFACPATSSAFWFRIHVQNHTEEDAWLEVSSIYAWYIDFYAPDSIGKYQKTYLTGTMRSENPPYYEVMNGFWLPLNKAGETKTKIYYLRIKEDFPFEAPLQVGTIRSLSTYKSISDDLTAGFVGIMFIMFVYNAFVYYSTKNHIYGLYLGCIVVVSLTSTYLSGYTPLFCREHISTYYFFYQYPTFLFIGFFCIHYLRLKDRFRIGYTTIIGFTVILGVYALLNVVGIRIVDMANSYQGFIILHYSSCFFIACYMVFRGYRNAIFYVAGWVFALLSVFVFAMTINGILPYNPFTRNAIYFGAIMEVLMFSFALTDRMNIIQKQKEASQQALLENQRVLLGQIQENERLVREQNLILEEKVKERTEELTHTLELIHQQKKVIEEVNEKMTASIRYALQIQKSIIPHEKEIQKHFTSFVLFKPKDIVSGDFYWFATMEDKKIMVAADCAGHGVAGAFMTMIGNTILNQIVHDHAVYEPHKILKEMCLLLEQTLSHTDGKIKESMDVVILTFYEQNHQIERIEYAGAMNPLYYVEGENFIEIKADKKPVDSHYQEDFEFQKHEIQNKHGLMLYLFSDGFQDQFGGEDNRKFMVGKFKKLLHQIAEEPINEQKHILESNFLEWKGEQTQTDDIMVIGIRI